MPGATPRHFGPPMVDEYALAARRRRLRGARERALLRARTGLSSVTPRSTVHSPPRRSWWARLVSL